MEIGVFLVFLVMVLVLVIKVSKFKELLFSPLYMREVKGDYRGYLSNTLKSLLDINLRESKN